MGASLPHFFMTYLRLITLASCGALLAACGSSGEVDIDQPIEVQSYTTVMGSKNLEDPVHGKEVEFAYGAISGVNETKANGVAYRHTFADGTSVMTINLNILPAPKGKVFVAWLSDDAGTSYVHAGALSSILSDARHTLRLETKEPSTKLMKVVVTLESTEKPQAPNAKHVAEGLLKIVKK